MRIEQFDYLIAVYETGSINQASKPLHTSPQNVSKSLKQLEEEWSIPLFTTSRQGTCFTPQGEEAVVLAQTILDLINDFKVRNASMTKQPAGDIYIVASKMPSLSFLNDLIFQFNALYPDINIFYTETDVLKVFELIYNDPRYIGFSSCYSNNQQSTIPTKYGDIFNLIPLQEDYVIALVQKGSALSHQKSISFQSLAKQRLGVLINNDDLSESFFHQVLKLHHCDCNIVFTTSNNTLRYKGIAEGRFISASSRKAFATYDDFYKNKMVALNIRDNALFTNDLVLRKDTNYDWVTHCFLDFIKEAMNTK